MDQYALEHKAYRLQKSRPRALDYLTAVYTKRPSKDSCLNTCSATLVRQLTSSEKRSAVFADAREFRHWASRVSPSSMPESFPELNSDENKPCAFTY